MEGYPGNTKVVVASTILEPNTGSQITALIEDIKELAKAKVGRDQVWCTNCRTEGHFKMDGMPQSV